MVPLWAATVWRPSPLMWPKIQAAIAANSTSHWRPPLKCGHDFLVNRVALLEGHHCISSYVNSKISSMEFHITQQTIEIFHRTLKYWVSNVCAKKDCSGESFLLCQVHHPVFIVWNITEAMEYSSYKNPYTHLQPYTYIIQFNRHLYSIRVYYKHRYLTRKERGLYGDVLMKNYDTCVTCVEREEISCLERPWFFAGSHFNTIEPILKEPSFRSDLLVTLQANNLKFIMINLDKK